MLIRRVENKTFRNAVVHITGNAYIGCKFYDSHQVPFPARTRLPAISLLFCSSHTSNWKSPLPVVPMVTR